MMMLGFRGLGWACWCQDDSTDLGGGVRYIRLMGLVMESPAHWERSCTHNS